MVSTAKFYSPPQEKKVVSKFKNGADHNKQARPVFREELNPPRHAVPNVFFSPFFERWQAADSSCTKAQTGAGCSRTSHPRCISPLSPKRI